VNAKPHDNGKLCRHCDDAADANRESITKQEGKLSRLVDSSKPRGSDVQVVEPLPTSHANRRNIIDTEDWVVILKEQNSGVGD